MTGTGAGWNGAELSAIGTAEELGVASRRGDGSLRPFVTTWVVGVDDGVYIRSARGPENPWFRRASAAGTGRIRAGGVERDVTFGPADSADAALHRALDAAYHAKYDRYGPSIVGSVVGPSAAEVTLRLGPRN